jgi:hypothetical protein
MGNTTLANSATPAKPDLLAYGAHITAVMFATSRDDLLNYSDDLCEVFGRPVPEPAPVPAPPQPAPVPRRQRKRSLAKVCEAARKAGADRVIVDGVVIALSPATAVPESDAPESDANEWDVVLPEVDHGAN